MTLSCKYCPERWGLGLVRFLSIPPPPPIDKIYWAGYSWWCLKVSLFCGRKRKPGYYDGSNYGFPWEVNFIMARMSTYIFSGKVICRCCVSPFSVMHYSGTSLYWHLLNMDTHLKQTVNMDKRQFYVSRVTSSYILSNLLYTVYKIKWVTIPVRFFVFTRWNGMWPITRLSFNTVTSFLSVMRILLRSMPCQRSPMSNCWKKLW